MGDVMEYSDARFSDLMRAYDEYMDKCKYIRMPEVYHAVANMPAKRFWVSTIRAALVISAMIRGEDPLKKMRGSKKEMYLEIYKRVMELRENNKTALITELCDIVVAQPAPKFYLTPKTVKVMICKRRKEWIEKKKRKLRLL